MTTIHHGLDVNVPTTQAAPGQTGQAQTQVQAQPGKPVEAASAPQPPRPPEPIRQALSNGSYQVDAGRVADGLLAAQKFDAQATQASGSVTQSSSAKAFADTARNT